ncbi:MAG: hypothetical protein KDI32_08745, partial [Pseudomonadales bacterium]|nr:hypothetical protein [Pseudomonadales bacterium]
RSATWGDQVFLGGTGSRDPGGSVDGYAWAQVAGPSVALANANTSLAQFFAPKVTAATVLRFQLIVTDNVGLTSSPDFVDITVEPPAGGIVTVQGRITYERVPFSTTLGSGLDYSATHAEPARGVTVEVSDHGTGFAYVRASTDANGNYAVSVPGNRTLQVTAIAELARTAPQPLPHWNIQVRRGHATSAFLYRASGPAFSSGTGFTADLNIPAGWDAVTRQPNGERAAAPFAILDTLYRSIDKLLTVAPTADFPQVTIDWSTDNGASTTYFDPRDGTDERFISLAGKAGIDIDEYDPHTIAHEFGHYIQDRFARSDSIGGDHAFDDRLDPRVAFGEGFGYAFAAIVLDDPLVRDAIGPTQSSETYFNVESDSVTNEGWYNETSVQEILWDLYDSTNDGSDTLSLGLAPLWAILTGPQRNDESFATIFQFVAALRAANAAFATQIDAIVGGESIVAPTIDRYASTETNAAQVTRTSDVLPVYANIGIGTGAVVVRSIDTFGTYNKLSNRRFLRLQSTGPQRIRITATIAGGHDPDVVVWDRGQRIAAGTVSGNEDFSVNLGTGTYLLETYECANAGCGGVATGPYDISIAVTPF